MLPYRCTRDADALVSAEKLGMSPHPVQEGVNLLWGTFRSAVVALSGSRVAGGRTGSLQGHSQVMLASRRPLESSVAASLSRFLTCGGEFGPHADGFRATALRADQLLLRQRAVESAGPLCPLIGTR